MTGDVWVWMFNRRHRGSLGDCVMQVIVDNQAAY